MADPNYTPFGPEPMFVPDEPIAEMTPSFGAYFNAAAGNVIRDSPLSSIYRLGELAAADSQGGGQQQSRRLSPDDARAKAEAAGVKVDFGDTKYTPEAVDIMIDRAKRRAVRDMTISAYDPSLGTQLGVSLLTSLADPLNVGAAFIPFVGTARYASALANTTSLAGRTAVRARLGAVEGLAGAALVEPLIAGAATQEGRDYALADSLYNLGFGTAFGGGLHAGGGAIKDAFFKRPMDALPAPVEGAPVAEATGASLPVQVQEAAMRASISDLLHGRSVQTSELLDTAIPTNPEIRESLSVASTLRRDGPDLDDMAGRVDYWVTKLTELKVKETKPVDFSRWLGQQGGVRDADGAVAMLMGGDTSHLTSRLYVSPKGAKRTARGLGLDDLLARAKAEGYVENMDELKAALQPGAKVLTQNTRQAQTVREALASHATMLQKESGVAANRPLSVRARAIAGREQHLLASERARIAASTDAVAARQQDYDIIAEGPVDAEVPEYVPPPRQSKSFYDQPDKKDADGEAAKTTEEILERVTDPTPRDASGKAIPGSRIYTERKVQKAIETAIKVNEGEAVPTERLFADYLPGMSKSKFDAAVKEIQKRKPALVKRNKDGVEVVMFGKLSKEKQLEGAAKMMQSKVDSVRRLMDARYPLIGAKKGPYTLNELFGADMRAKFEIGEAGIVKYINDAIRDGRIEATAPATSPSNPPRKIGRIGPDHLYSDDKGVDVLITFRDPAAPRPAANPLPPEVEVKPLPPREVTIATPPADISALKPAELAEAEAQFAAVEAEAIRRYEAVASMLGPKEAARIKAMLETTNAEAKDLENVIDTAVACLLQPES